MTLMVQLTAKIHSMIIHSFIHSIIQLVAMMFADPQSDLIDSALED